MRGLIPHREFKTLTDRLFSDFWNEVDAFDVPSLFGDNRKNKFAYPKMNIRNDGSNTIIEAAVPGLTEDNVTVEYSDGLLYIKGSSQNVAEDDRNGYLVRELHKSSFARSVRIDPKDHDIEKIEAAVENGVLTIKIPSLVIEQKEVKKITVKGVDST